MVSVGGDLIGSSEWCGLLLGSVHCPAPGLPLVYGAEQFALRERAEAPNGLVHSLAPLPVSRVTLAKCFNCVVPQCPHL